MMELYGDSKQESGNELIEMYFSSRRILSPDDRNKDFDCDHFTTVNKDDAS